MVDVRNACLYLGLHIEFATGSIVRGLSTDTNYRLGQGIVWQVVSVTQLVTGLDRGIGRWANDDLWWIG